MAKKLDAEYWAVSSLTGDGIREMFRRLACVLFESSIRSELDAADGHGGASGRLSIKLNTAMGCSGQPDKQIIGKKCCSQ